MTKSKRKLVGGVPGEEAGKLLGMLEDLNQKLRKGVITAGQLAFFLQKKNPFIPSAVNEFSALIFEWQEFYRGVFGINVDLSNLVIPAQSEGFDHLLVIAEGMTPQRLYDKCAELFPSWKWTDRDLDGVIVSDRTSQNGAYAIWVRNRVEADEELKNLSANQLKERGIPGITLEERLAYELKYFRETGNHLDTQNVTLCTGSRFSGGHVPLVLLHGGHVSVGWALPVYRHDFLRSRQAVSV